MTDPTPCPAPEEALIGPNIALARMVLFRLGSSQNVRDLVPYENVREDSTLPDRLPGILLVPGVTIRSADYVSWHERSYLDLHIWSYGAMAAARIEDAVCSALKSRPWSAPGWTVHGLSLRTTLVARSTKDIAAGLYHRLVTVDAVLQGTGKATVIRANGTIDFGAGVTEEINVEFDRDGVRVYPLKLRLRFPSE